MTDKLKLFKVRLASGGTRAIVAPSGGDVWALTFSTAKSAQETGQIDDVLSVEYAHDVDGVFFREPPPEQSGKCEKCGKWLYRSNGQLQPCGWCAQGGYALDPALAAQALESLSSEARSTWNVGDACPQCSHHLRASLGQLVCDLGHQVGNAPRDIAGDANARLCDWHPDGCPDR